MFVRKLWGSIFILSCVTSLLVGCDESIEARTGEIITQAQTFNKEDLSSQTITDLNKAKGALESAGFNVSLKNTNVLSLDINKTPVSLYFEKNETNNIYLKTKAIIDISKLVELQFSSKEFIQLSNQMDTILQKYEKAASYNELLNGINTPYTIAKITNQDKEIVVALEGYFYQFSTITKVLLDNQISYDIANQLYFKMNSKILNKDVTISITPIIKNY